MNHRIAQRLSELAVAYAQNRRDLRENGAAIKQVQSEADGAYFDLKPYRERYYNDPDVHDLPLGGCIVWHGWLHAVETCDPDNYYGEDCGYRATARLMDQRRDIKREASRIRAALTRIGDQISRSVP
ncbi:hypothetical protein FBY06_11585 [Pseudomonas sp. SJZ085]|uniref:hypothetical protein n=1 Tax=unclassified Pseudomonas TaxID=196821 RepID=UPI0011995271|nr:MULTISPECIES: hypothetical protein [unclassified Pseudomonas]TWC18160.1 hypothetical protein FBX99_11585 [Pseudomonas sp. SJZ074]TWC36132.1 hypothetical protein FBY06_11585 [Pseudomonas sp. SJZ085]